MLRTRLAALATALAITVTSTAAMAWETYAPPFGGVGRPYAWTIARIRDVAVLRSGEPAWVSFDQSINAGCAALLRVDPGVSLPFVSRVGITEFHSQIPGNLPESNTTLSIILWAKAQNIPVRIRVDGSQGICSLVSVETCSDPATCADPPTNP
jgi:hypothetical protein